MKTIQILVLVFCCSSVLAQTSHHYVVLPSKADTTSWFVNQDSVIKKLSLTRMDMSKNPFSLRIWKANQVIDIWANSKGVYTGELISWTDEYNPKNHQPTSRTSIYKVLLGIDTVSLLINMFDSSSILEGASANFMINRYQRADGKTYIFEHSIRYGSYYRRTWMSKVQDSLRQARDFRSFVNIVFDKVSAKSVWDAFEKTISYTCYTRDGEIIWKQIHRSHWMQKEKYTSYNNPPENIQRQQPYHWRKVNQHRLPSGAAGRIRPVLTVLMKSPQSNFSSLA